MGNLMLNQLSEQQSLDLLDRNVSRKGTADIYQFGCVPLFKNEITNQYFFSHECEFLIPSEQQSRKSLEMLKKINNSCPNLIHIWRIVPKSDFTSCNGKSKLVVYFEYLPISLRELLQSRKSPFPESEVLHIFNSLLTAVRHLNSKESYHGDITPEFVYFDEQGTYKYKIFDPVYFNPTRSGYYRAQNQKVYCAPQILANLNEKRIYPLYNHYICDTFSIGLVVLYCMTLIDPLVAYQNQQKQIDYYYIESLLRVAHRYNYSQQLIKCVRECLLVKNRPTVREILENYQFLNIDQQHQRFKFSLKKN